MSTQTVSPSPTAQIRAAHPTLQSCLSRPIQPNTRTLYGVRVSAQHFTTIKTIADALVGQTDHREYLKDARRGCALIALAACEEARRFYV